MDLTKSYKLHHTITEKNNIYQKKRNNISKRDRFRYGGPHGPYFELFFIKILCRFRT